ncbi:MAG: hypothetical protein RLZZ306_3368 [Bacteroidota bacterium]|jgi:two-component system LytT family response regulator
MSPQLQNQNASFLLIQKHLKVPISEIVFFEAEQNYTHAHMRNGKRLTIARTLKDFEIALENHQFYRIHRAFLVNKSHLKGTNSVLGEVILTNNHRIVASRRRKYIFENMIN